ncbi:MAG: PhoH family protein [Ignavibacteria bacterium]|jgi:phosphate starvation-inducible PhoH-like protein
MRDKSTYAKKKRKKAEESENHSVSSEVYLYLPENYRSKVLTQSTLARLMEIVSFTVYEENKNVTRFVSSVGKTDKLRSMVNVLEQVYRILTEYDYDDEISDVELEDLISEYFKNTNDSEYKWNKEAIYQDARGRYFTPRTENQKILVESIRKNIVTIVEGAAGTGKSRIALIMALNMLGDNRINKIIVIRPLVAVGGDIGYLPGGVDEKIDPYQSPISEALIELIGKDTYDEYIENERIILYPAAFARGCNISDAFVIVDEAQNFDEVTLLTLLTRICGNTKMVLTGDSSQDDRKNKHREESGLSTIKKKLKGEDGQGIENVAIVEMGFDDVQRSRIVKDILIAFDV